MVDGVALPVSPVRLAHEGKFNKVAFLAAGSNTNEGTLFTYPEYVRSFSFSFFFFFFFFPSFF